MRSREYIKEKVQRSADRFGSINAQQLKQLTLLCEKTDEVEVFYGLYLFFCEAQAEENKFHRQQLSAKLLYTVKPRPALRLDACVYADAGVWDYSVEQLPWY